MMRGRAEAATASVCNSVWPDAASAATADGSATDAAPAAAASSLDLPDPLADPLANVADAWDFLIAWAAADAASAAASPLADSEACCVGTDAGSAGGPSWSGLGSCQAGSSIAAVR